MGIGTEKTQLLQLTDENISLFTEWLQADHVKRWYTHRDAWLREVQKRRKEFDWIHHYIIWKDDMPVGFCQYYPYWKSGEDWEGSISKDGTYSIDYMIGRAEYLRKGIARRAVIELLRLISMEEGAKRVIVQPEEENIASKAVLLSVGFSYDSDNALFIINIRENLDRIAPLFAGWQETMIWSCLQGQMGFAASNEQEIPKAAFIEVGDFCFLAGEPDQALLLRTHSPLLVPRKEDWSQEIERVFGKAVFRASRYSIKKEPDVFDRCKLEGLVKSLSDDFEWRLIDEAVYKDLLKYEWSRDLCSQFKNYDDYNKRGVGVVVLYRGVPVSGASSYTVYDGGIEIEIDTREDYRNQGLATVCGSALILECLRRGIYPSWDAHDLRSVALAEKLGYHMEQEYPVYIREDSGLV